MWRSRRRASALSAVSAQYSVLTIALYRVALAVRNKGLVRIEQRATSLTVALVNIGHTLRFGVCSAGVDAMRPGRRWADCLPTLTAQAGVNVGYKSGRSRRLKHFQHEPHFLSTQPSQRSTLHFSPSSILTSELMDTFTNMPAVVLPSEQPEVPLDGEHAGSGGGAYLYCIVA